MTKYRVSVSTDDDQLFTHEVEASDSVEATTSALEEFKRHAEVTEASGFDIRVEAEDE